MKTALAGLAGITALVAAAAIKPAEAMPVQNLGAVVATEAAAPTEVRYRRHHARRHVVRRHFARRHYVRPYRHVWRRHYVVPRAYASGYCDPYYGYYYGYPCYPYRSGVSVRIGPIGFGFW